MMLRDRSARANNDREQFETTTENATVRNNVRAMAFWRSRPVLWFVSMEAKFVIAGITADEFVSVFPR